MPVFICPPNIIKKLRPAQPAGFYHRSARKVIETGVRSISLKGLIRELNSGVPVSDAVLEVKALNGTALSQASSQALPIIKRSARKGGFIVKHLPEGSYSLRIHKEGFREKSVEFFINPGELSVLDVSLERLQVY